jgi:stage II sporulation protein D
MTNFRRPKLPFLLLIAILLFSVSLPIFNFHTYASLPKLDDIRVTLFIEARGTVPHVTLSSGSGLSIGIRQPDGLKQWIQSQPNKAVKFSMNAYRLLMLETADYSSAKALYNKLDEASFQPLIFAGMKQGAAVYMVYAGQYGTKEQAALALKRLSAYAEIMRFVPNASVRLTGPLYWNAGTYAAESEALKQLAALSDKGIHASLVYQQAASGGVSYSVWLGEAADTAQLDSVKAKVNQLAPNVALQPIDPAAAYLIKRDDVSGGTSAADTAPHYMFNVSGQKVWVTSGQPGIKVSERSGRTYRGSIELSQHKGQLAVINQLPFEQYLYSVLGSELDSNWPLEALKAQAVAARTYALRSGMKYQIAHISDTTYDQAYYGMGREFTNGIAAVDATAGEVLVNQDGLVTPFYYSNSGGVTADPLEVWGNPIRYVRSKPSPDEDAQRGKLAWHRIAMPDGKVGYIRSDFIKDTGTKNKAGLPYYESQGTAINVRPAPYVDNVNNAPIAQVNIGDRFVSFEQTMESNSFQWIRGPYSAEELLNVINSKIASPIPGKLNTLEVTERGVSGRVMKLRANGQEIAVSRPDNYRTVLGSLPSTRFDIEEMGRYTILGAGGNRRTLPGGSGALYVIGAEDMDPRSGTVRSREWSDEQLFMLNAQGKVRLAAKDPEFRFIGLGFGHGLGMSQWGARVWAELGYDYQYILQYYYHEVSIVKE